MVKVELLCRYSKDAGSEVYKEIELALDTEEIIKGDKFDRDKARERMLKTNKNIFEYGSMVIDLKDISSYNSVDKYHTHVAFYNGRSFTYKVPFEIFKDLYQSLMSVLIHDFTDLSKYQEK